MSIRRSLVVKTDPVLWGLVDPTDSATRMDVHDLALFVDTCATSLGLVARQEKSVKPRSKDIVDNFWQILDPTYRDLVISETSFNEKLYSIQKAAERALEMSTRDLEAIDPQVAFHTRKFLHNLLTKKRKENERA